jgi:nucleoside-diphosphate-sugar epimerase
MASGEVPRHNHGFKLGQEIILREERGNQIEEFTMIEDSLYVAEETLHDVFIRTIINIGSQFFKIVALSL